MLRLILGPAGSGKTSFAMGEIDARARRGEGGIVMVVPEQYSFEVERELVRMGGNGAALHAEVLSFSRFATRVAQERGTGGRIAVDGGGRLLCMSLALEQAGGQLEVYGAARYKAELLSSLLTAVTELKMANVSADALEKAAEEAEPGLSAKLRDLSICLEAYDAVLAQGKADPSDRLLHLAETLGESSVGRGGFYFDGFTDFTGAETAVIKALLERGADVTVCLTCDGLFSEKEHFATARAAALQLKRIAEEAGQTVEVVTRDQQPKKARALAFYDAHLFGWTDETMDAENAVRVFRCESLRAECELAASECVRFARETGCRWRELAVAVRGFDNYAAPLSEAFRLYGVPLFTAKRGSILQKPLPALIDAAFEILETDWDADAVLAYLKTGLTGFTLSERDALEGYVVRWNVRGRAMWARETPWLQHPDGFGKTETEASQKKLDRVNKLRRRLAQPLLRLSKNGRKAETAAEQAKALSDFLLEINLPETLAKKAAGLEKTGRGELAAEYAQLWDIVIKSIEQTAALLGDTAMEQSRFAKLFLRTLSQYDVSAIPVSLDSVSAGDMDRMRRRHIKHLIVLGASDDRVPRVTEPGGVFSADERDALMGLHIPIGGGTDGLDREFGTIYNCLTLPADTLTFSYAALDGNGAKTGPGFPITRAKALFKLPEESFDRAFARLEAEAPAFLLAAGADNGGAATAARACFSEEKTRQKELSELRKTAAAGRGSLSPITVTALYGQTPRLSPSRTDAFEACRFFYFLRYGLRLNEKEQAGFEAPEYGSFVHYVLQNTVSEVENGPGFASADEKFVDRLVNQYTDLYIKQQLHGFADKSPRFRYLFDRLRGPVQNVTLDTVKELSLSKFSPLDFELSFMSKGELPPVQIENGPVIDGIADRVDGWEQNGQLFLRVIDYKTGKKAFSYTDVQNGMGMQMLLYLFALESEGQGRYGKQIVPAGVLYVPARDAVFSAPGRLTDEELAKKKAKTLQRSGLILNDADVIGAMEDAEKPQYIPVSFHRDGSMNEESLATPEQFQKLRGHVESCLRALDKDMRGGSIDAVPYYKSEQENACLWCPYKAVCRFDEARDRYRYLAKVEKDAFWNGLEDRDDG